MNQEQYDEEAGITGATEVHWYGNGWALVATALVVAYLVW